MHRGFVHALAWTLATGAAVTLSWWGVHTVMSGTAYDPPLAVPLTTRPLSSSTHDAATPSPARASDSPSPSASASPSASPSTSASAAKPSQKAAPPGPSPDGQRGGGGDPGNVKAYPVTGGRVVFDLGTSSAELVSATPDAGWQMQVWKQPYWIRVTFTKDGKEMSVFCTWNGHPPMVETYEG
ncbi:MULTISPECIES: hypothetical protein [unclassified Streptomyces]|uniref:hypothetical protein n=1 Tax=unclassified Streptomyces TaxID=2593676 RepID=UPI00225AA2FA|nr:MULTISPECIES: hypothetical protein [unclassified Streptomyces]MCX4526002.1 hypothetical protein [Streptomyces sp. NBC_01551]MCX4543435.1 hypothetical protein [Streptomyces sp. NBC_01565]